MYIVFLHKYKAMQTYTMCYGIDLQKYKSRCAQFE